MNSFLQWSGVCIRLGFSHRLNRRVHLPVPRTSLRACWAGASASVGKVRYLEPVAVDNGLFLTHVVKTGEECCSFKARKLFFLFPKHVFGGTELTRVTGPRPRSVA